MAANFPGPYELRFTYTTVPAGLTALPHTQRLNLDLTTTPTPGTAFADIDAKTKGGILTPDLASVVDAWHSLIDILHNDQTTLGITELWSYTPLSFQSVFISSYNSGITDGLTVAAAIPAQQDILTFRTLEGGTLKVNFMERPASPYGSFAYPTAVAVIDAVFDFVTSDASWILARDTSYINGNLNWLVGQNEKLFRTRYRS